MLSVDEVATRWRLGPVAVRSRIASGELGAVRLGGQWRASWESVWSCEQGGVPDPELRALYRAPLLTKRDVACAMGVSLRTVERWIRDGLPTRSVGRHARFQPHEVSTWLRARFGVALPAGAPCGRGARACAPSGRRRP